MSTSGFSPGVYSLTTLRSESPVSWTPLESLFAGSAKSRPSPRRYRSRRGQPRARSIDWPDGGEPCAPSVLPGASCGGCHEPGIVDRS